MPVKTGQAAAGGFVTKDTLGQLSAATAGPVGTLYVNGVANAAVVTITGANPYKWAVTLPTLAAGDVVQVYVTATVAGFATAGWVWEETADTVLGTDLGGRIPAALVDGKMDSTPTDLTGIATESSAGAIEAAVGGITIPTPPTPDEIAEKILAIPANLLVTDADGKVSVDQTAITDALDAMKGAGWTDENLSVIQGILAGVYGAAGSGWVVKAYRSKLPGGTYGPGIQVLMAYTHTPNTLYGPQVSDIDGWTYWIGRTGVDRGRFYNKYGGYGYAVDEEDF